MRYTADLTQPVVMATSDRDEKTKSYVGDKKTAKEFLAAARAGDVGRVGELLAADPCLARATGSGGGGWTAVHGAASCGHTAVVRRLLDALPELLHAETVWGGQPAHQAAWGGHADVLGVLIERGARVDAQDQYGQTPLHRAAAAVGNREACVRALLAAGARVDMKTDSGKTARDVAEGEGHSNIVALLEAHDNKARSHNNSRKHNPAETVTSAEDSIFQNVTKVPAAAHENSIFNTHISPCDNLRAVDLSRSTNAANSLMDVASNSSDHINGEENSLRLDSTIADQSEQQGGNPPPGSSIIIQDPNLYINMTTPAQINQPHQEFDRTLDNNGSQINRFPSVSIQALQLGDNTPTPISTFRLDELNTSGHQMPNEMEVNISHSSFDHQIIPDNTIQRNQVIVHPLNDQAHGPGFPIKNTRCATTTATPSYSQPVTHHQPGPIGPSGSHAGSNATAEEGSVTISVPTAAVAQNPAHNPTAGDQHMDSDPSMVSTDTAPPNVDTVDTAPSNVEMDSSECMVYMPDVAADAREHTRSLQTKVAKKRPPQWTEPQVSNRAGPPQARLRLLCELCESLTDDFASHLVREHGADRRAAERAEQHEHEQAVTMYNETRMVDPAWLEREMRGAVLSYNGLVRILRQLGHHVTARRRVPAAAAGVASTQSSSHQSPTPPTDYQGSLQHPHQHAPAASATFPNHRDSEQSPTDDHIPLKKRKTFEPGRNIAHQQFRPVDQHGENALGGIRSRTASSGSLHRRPGKFSFTIPCAEWKDNVKDLVYSENSRHFYYTNVSNVFRKYFSVYCDCNINMKNNFFKHTKTPNFEAKFVCKQNCSHYIATVDKLEENFPVVFNVQRISIDDHVIHRNSQKRR